MTTVTREQVASALFTLLKTSHSYPTSSRRFKTWSDIPAVQKPALYMVEHEEEHVRGKQLVPAIRTLMVDVYLFISTGMDKNSVPIITLNNLIDAIDPVSGGVLKPGFNGKQTLGGLATDCYIEGKITKVPGDIDGQGVAIIPIKVIFMQP